MRGLKVNFILFYFLLFCGTVGSAQVANFDSLAVKAGFIKPLIIAQMNFSESAEEDMQVGSLLTQFTIPGNGKVISHFGIRSGRMHTGTDIKMSKGDTVYAAYNGIVVNSKYYYGYGNLIIIQHERNLETYYGHLSGYLVKAGMKVNKGEPIGLAGATGRATTSHLHYELRENDEPYDAELIFDFENKTIKPGTRMLTSLVDLEQRSSKTQQFADNPASQKYVVRSGDSLWIISRKSKTTVENLCQLNNIAETAVLQVGQVLNIY